MISCWGIRDTTQIGSLSADIGRAGYQIDKMEGIYLKPFTTSQMLSLKLDEESDPRLV